MSKETNDVEKLIITSDCGFNFDDYMAILWLLKTYNCPTLIITTFWRPDEKASILGCIVKILERKNVDIIAGNGIYGGAECFTKETYPTWPNEFGNPIDIIDDDDAESIQRYGCVYPYQINAFKENYSDLFDDPAVNVCNFPVLIDKFMGKSKLNEVTLINMGLFTNTAYILQHHACKIKNIITTTGWHGSFNDPIRPEYNIHMDMSSANVVFCQIGTSIPVLVFSSEFCDVFKMKQEEWNKFLLLDNKFGKTMLDVAKNWEIHKARKNGKSENVVTIDPPRMHNFTSVVCALKYLNKFKKYGIHYALHPENIFMYGSPIVFMDTCESKEPDAEKQLFTLRSKAKSNIELVSFDDSNITDDIYSSMMNELFTMISTVQ